MNVELIAVGTELTALGRHDTNSAWLAERLNRLGHDVVARCAIDDDVGRIAAAVRWGLERADVVLVTGGLGPTEDDRTRDALALALGVELEEDERQLERLRELYRAFGRSLDDHGARQARRPRGSFWIDNPRGSAAGIRVERGSKLLFALPGVPIEMRTMFGASVLPRLRVHGAPALARRTLKVAGRAESSVDAQLRDLYGSPGIELTVLCGTGELELHVRARSGDGESAETRMGAFERAVRERLGPDLFGVDDETLATVVGRLLRGAGRSVATAESCTAGMLAAAITAVPGSSAWYLGGVVVYSDGLKVDLAGVKADTLARHGAVSAEVANELARGARDRCGADYGIGVTGIAGPGGATPGKPVGLVHLALADGDDTASWKLRLPGDRRAVRLRTVAAALDALRRRLVGAR